MSHLLTKKEIGDLAKAHQTGRDLLFKVNQKQVSILASIGIPMLLNAIMPKSGSGATRLGRSGWGGPRMSGMPYRPPPYIGTWGKGKKSPNKIKSGQGLLLGKNSPFNSIPIIEEILYREIRDFA